MGKHVVRSRNIDWMVWEEDNGRYNNDQVSQMILMDIRDELRRLNALLHCGNFTAIPTILRGIRTKLPTKKPRKRAKP